MLSKSGCRLWFGRFVRRLADGCDAGRPQVDSGGGKAPDRRMARIEGLMCSTCLSGEAS